MTNNSLEYSENSSLNIFCVDMVSAKETIYPCTFLIEKMQMIYQFIPDGLETVEETIDKVFDILFEAVSIKSK